MINVCASGSCLLEDCEEDCLSWQDLWTPTAPSQRLSVLGESEAEPKSCQFSNKTLPRGAIVWDAKMKILMVHLDKYEPRVSEDS